MADINIIKSGDGSHTLFHPELNETYHSTHGAITESQHVFIKKGLEHFVSVYPQKKVKILEVGFGTGLNILLTIQKALELNVEVEIISLEKFPLTAELISGLNYANLLQWEKAKDYFDLIHNAKWNEETSISEKISLTKIDKGLEEFETMGSNLVYFDAFAPNKQPELWEQKVLQHVYDLCDENSIFTTYCAKGQVRRDLQAVGFKVERLDGPPGKREMLRGTKQQQQQQQQQQ